ncbi:exosortase F system-associated membrane protein [Flavobacterium degerlachei]|jgi:exosortase F-associated protein|uniref:Exosortase F-associated protein n=1 Tax=Flavobacterium degerlachei TaxID=229203 RepID=A0A1H3ATD1_9FLAO|nr:exosortase F system-associated protein [Flavobacterium degerlachei]SDX32099.1 exosortase F-associated protein [Flavobacterium degerlachei]
MLRILLTHKFRFFIVLLFVLSFVLIRVYEDNLFYDPFLNYFKSDFNDLPLPIYNSFRLFLSLLFRYGLNMVLSLGLIFILFKDIGMVKFASFLYVVFFALLVFSFYATISIYGEHNNMMLFYVRRFLIQPIFILLFIPAFYYQKLSR